MLKYKTVLIFGPPGTGKGTQAKLLEKTGKYFHFSMGQMCRSLNVNTEVGRIAKNLVDKGELLPNDLAIKLFQENINNLVREKIFQPKEQILILDGVPRNVEQIRLINRLVDIKKIIYLKINPETVIERARKRLNEEQRNDDRNPDVVMRRLEIFKKETLQMLNHYDKRLIVEIDGSKSVEKINREIINFLEKTSFV